MLYQYDFTICGVRITFRSAEKLNVPERFLPFESKGDPNVRHDIAVDIVFEKTLPDYGDNAVGAGVFLKDERIYSLIAITENRIVIREENAICGGDVVLHVPESYKDYFCRSGKWINFLSVERMLLPFGLFMIHASGVLLGKKALLFSAPSGGGKSTQARLWLENEKAETINGDKIFLSQKNGKLFAHGSPSAGTSGIYKNICAEVSGIFILEKSQTNHLDRLSKRQAMLALYSEAVKSPFDKNYNDSLLGLIAEAIEHTEVYNYKCLPDKSAVDHISDYLKRGRKI